MATSLSLPAAPDDQTSELGAVILLGAIGIGAAVWWMATRPDFHLVPDGTLLTAGDDAGTRYLVVEGQARPLPASAFSGAIATLVPPVTVAAILGPPLTPPYPPVVPVPTAGIPGITRPASEGDPFARSLPDGTNSSPMAASAFYGDAALAPVLEAANPGGDFVGRGALVGALHWVIVPPRGAAMRLLDHIRDNADLLGSSARLILAAG